MQSSHTNVVLANSSTIKLMAMFTFFWCLFVFAGLPIYTSIPLFITFAVVSWYLLKTGKQFSTHAQTSASNSKTDQQAKTDKYYARIFTTEGVGIGIAAGILGATNHIEYMVPVIILIVGIHFYPLAYLFKRTASYYIGTYLCVTGITGTLLIVHTMLKPYTVWSFTGLATACATSAYGFYLSRKTRSLFATSHSSSKLVS